MHVTYRSIKTRFRFAYTYRLKLATYTNSLTHYTKGTQSGLVAPPTACKHSVSGSFSLPLSGCFSPFPHGTCSLSVTQLSLGEWSPHLQTEFLVLRPTQDKYISLLLRGYHPLRLAFPDNSDSLCIYHRLVRFRSPLLSESRLISFPAGT